MSYPPFIYKKSTNIFFSVSFALILPFFVLVFPISMITFNLIFLPFSLIHEVGHFITSLWLLPSHEPMLHFKIVGGELICTCDMSQELLCCWNSIIVVLGGTGSVMLSVLLFFFLLTKSGYQNALHLGKLYLLFGLLSDLPNLFPILPSTIRSPTDGFILYSFLSQMNFIPLLSSGVSYFFSLASFIVVLISFYFLGSFIFQFLLFFLKVKSESTVTEEL
jgi:hypothetical protein